MKRLLRILFFFTVLAVHGQTVATISYGSVSGSGNNNIVITFANNSTNAFYYRIVGTGTTTFDNPSGTSSTYYSQGSLNTGVNFVSVGSSTYSFYSQGLSYNNYWTTYVFSGTIQVSTISSADVASEPTEPLNISVSSPDPVAGANSGFNYNFNISVGQQLVYTNYTGTVVNNLGVTGVATWYFDGSLVQTETLAPAQSGSWTTPSIEVSPVAQAYTFTASINSVGNSIGYNNDGTPNFTAGNTGGGDSTTLTGSGSSQTNTVTGNGTSGGGGATITTNGVSLASGTNSEVVIGTNIVSWSPPTGVASESTLEAAATLAHSDSVNLLQGEDVLHRDLGVVTNELGQLIGGVSSNNVLGFNADTYLASINTNIAREIQIASTNGQFVIQSNTAVYNTNIADIYITNEAQENTLEGVSNILAAHFGTNNSAYTNYAEESTLEGMSNLMAQILVTNSAPPDTNAMLAAGQPYAEQGSNLIMSLSDGVPATPANAADTPMGANGMNWIVQIPLPGGSSYSADLNPFDVPWVVTLAAFVRSLVKWILISGLLMSNINEVSAALRSMGSTRQATAALDASVAASFSALSMASLITAVMLTIPFFAVTWFIDYLSDFAVNPFSGVSGLVGTAVWMCDQFLPLAVMVACVFCYYTFRVSLDATVWAVQTLTRFLVG